VHATLQQTGNTDPAPVIATSPSANSASANTGGSS
jgi:hypothetical protein